MLLIYSLFLPITMVICLRGPHHPRGHYHPKQGGPKITQDDQLLQDVTHLEEDLENIIPEDAIKKMTPEEMEFHYFKLHDFDNNTKLDGLEILQAIRHTLEHEHYKQEQKDKTLSVNEREKESETATLHPRLEDDFHYFVDLIDQVLAEDDTDEDGYLSYIEYVLGRQRDLMKKQNLIQT